jgi:hypothetical protein
MARANPVSYVNQSPKIYGIQQLYRRAQDLQHQRDGARKSLKKTFLLSAKHAMP